MASLSILVNKSTFGICACQCLVFSPPARLCSHPTDMLAGEMYLLTSINLTVLQAFETSFTKNELMEKRMFLFSE